MNKCLINTTTLFFITLSFLITQKSLSQTSTSTMELPSFKNIDLTRGWTNELYLTQDMMNVDTANTQSASIGAIDIYLMNNLKKSSNINGNFTFHFIHIQGSDPSLIAGDAQYVSNIAMPEEINRIGDLYYQHHFSNQVRWLVGIHDLSSEFNVTESSLNFVNASLGTNPEISMSGENGAPAWPMSSLASRMNIEFSNYDFKFGIYDGNPGDESTYSISSPTISEKEGALLISELQKKNSNETISLGLWSYTQKINDETSGGAYITLDQSLSQDLNLFIRSGVANVTTNMIQDSQALGLVYHSLLQADEDEMGLAVAQAHLQNDQYERATELYYQFYPTKNFALKPDFQYIHNLSGEPNKSAQVYGLRAVIEVL